MSEDESAPLLEFLFAPQVKPEFTCRFSWRAGSLAFWDNRCVQHNPINDYHGYPPVMHRITLAGDRPRQARAFAFFIPAPSGGTSRPTSRSAPRPARIGRSTKHT